MKTFLSFVLFVATLPIFSETCTYEYVPASSKVVWTAFKFTEKTGVNGTFDTISSEAKGKADQPEKILEKIQFSISTESINSNNPDRDQKIKTQFFGKTQTITGKFQLGKDKGTANLNLKLNGKTKSIPVTYTIAENQRVEAKLSIDVLDFGLSSGLARLNEVCLELHKGKDGVSKLWPNVDIALSTELRTECK